MGQFSWASKFAGPHQDPKSIVHVAWTCRYCSLVPVATQCDLKRHLIEAFFHIPASVQDPFYLFLLGFGSGGGTRTPDTRIMIPLL
jgi:hypothetical protein